MSHIPYGNQSQSQRPAERILASSTLTVERKTFEFSLRENGRGKFLRIIEEAAGKRNTIIVPAPGVADFIAHLNKLADRI